MEDGEGVMEKWKIKRDQLFRQAVCCLLLLSKWRREDDEWQCEKLMVIMIQYIHVFRKAAVVVVEPFCPPCSQIGASVSQDLVSAWSRTHKREARRGNDVVDLEALFEDEPELLLSEVA